jgi:hypothetical protein
LGANLQGARRPVPGERNGFPELKLVHLDNHNNASFFNGINRCSSLSCIGQWLFKDFYCVIAGQYGRVVKITSLKVISKGSAVFCGVFQRRAIRFRPEIPT